MNNTSHHELQPGTLLHNRYRIESLIGQGGFGITYKAVNLGLNQVVCIKELFAAGICVRGPENTVVFQGREAAEFPAFRQRFIREAQELARFRHPNIVRVSEVFEANQTAYFVMDFVEGETLRERVLREGRLKPEQALPLMHSLLDAVETVHNAGMLHRDIKPDNVLVEPSGKVVLIDFGSAKSFEDGRTLSQTAILTPGYAPLEQYSDRSQRGPFTDIYALGATFYFMLTGQKPLSAIDRQEFALEAPHNLFADISDILSSAIMLALNLRASDRFQSVPDMRAALNYPANEQILNPQYVNKRQQIEADLDSLRKKRAKNGLYSKDDLRELIRIRRITNAYKNTPGWQEIRVQIIEELKLNGNSLQVNGVLVLILLILFATIAAILIYIDDSYFKNEASERWGGEYINHDSMLQEERIKDSLLEALQRPISPSD